MEIWKPMLGFEGFYEISNFGNGRRISRGKKLNAEAVGGIKSMLSAGCTLQDAALSYGVSIPTISMIRDGKTWAGNHKFRPLKAHLRTDFYFNFLPCVEGKYTHYAVHRAVWEAFNGRIAEDFEINHKNLDRSDNRLGNLEVLTRIENIRHAIEYYQRDGGTHQHGGKYYAKKVALRKKRAAKNHSGNPE